MSVNHGFVFYATPNFEWCPTLIYTDKQGVYRITADEGKHHEESDTNGGEEKYYGRVLKSDYQGNVQFENLDCINITVSSLSGECTDLGYFLLTETVEDIKRTYEAATGILKNKQQIIFNGEIANDEQKVNTLELPLTVQIVD